MKRLVSIVLILVWIFSLSGCGKNDTYKISITVPAGTTGEFTYIEDFIYSDEDITFYVEVEGWEKKAIGGAYMTEKEFFQLEVGTVISNIWKTDTYFVIYDTDQMGTAYKGRKYIVYGARQMDYDKNFARIDIHNCQFWRIEGKI